MKNKISESADLKDSIAAFMEVGSERNKLVHQDYATFQLEKTMDEVYVLYQKASKFVDGVPLFLRDIALGSKGVDSR
jgi:hypothetical protein